MWACPPPFVNRQPCKSACLMASRICLLGWSGNLFFPLRLSALHSSSFSPFTHPTFGIVDISTTIPTEVFIGWVALAHRVSWTARVGLPALRFRREVRAIGCASADVQEYLPTASVGPPIVYGECAASVSLSASRDLFGVAKCLCR